MAALEDKVPKTVVNVISTLREAIRLFGCPTPINPKSIIKVLPKVLDHKNDQVRGEAKTLAVELYRWIGSSLLPSLSGVKDVTVRVIVKKSNETPFTS